MFYNIYNIGKTIKMAIAYKLNIWRLCGIMKTNKTKIIILIFIYTMLTIVLYMLLKDNFFFKDFNKIMIIIYLLLSIITIHYLLYKIFQIKALCININFSFIFYIGLIFLSLFYRKTSNTEQSTNPNYMRKWINIIFTNKVVFLNIIGNIFLFLPLGTFIYNIKLNIRLKMLIIIVVIISLEVLQYITKKGVFDYIDILLNLIGTIIGYCLCIRKDIYGRSRKEKRR